MGKTFVKMYAPQNFRTPGGRVIRDLTALPLTSVPAANALERVAEGYVPIEVYKVIFHLPTTLPGDKDTIDAILRDLRVRASIALSRDFGGLPFLPYADSRDQEKASTFVAGVIGVLESMLTENEK